MADRSQNETGINITKTMCSIGINTEDPTKKEEEGKEYPEEEGGDDESQRGVDRRRKRDECSDDEEEEDSGTNVSGRHEVTSNGDKGSKGRQQQLTRGEGEGEEREGESVHDDDEGGESQEGQEDIELKQDSGLSHEEEEEKKEDEKKEEGEEEKEGEEEAEAEEEEGEEEKEEEEEEGEGEEKEEEGEEETEVLTKDNPMFVPRAGPYFYHDSRFDDEDETGEVDQPTTEPMSTVTKLKCQELDKWEHDLYVAEDQKPREEWEKKKDREYYENLERRRNRQRDGDGADRSTRGRGSKLGDFMPSQRRGGAGNYREQHQNRKDWRSESGRYQEKEYRDKGRERRDGQYHQERDNERRGNRRDFRQYKQEREGRREGNRERREFNKRRGNWEGTNQRIPQENWEDDQEREKESWENNGENWEQDLETQEVNRKTTNKGEERESGFKNQRRSNQRDEYNHGRRPQGGWGSERNEERHQKGRQRNNEGIQDGRRDNSGRGRYDNDWQHSEGNRPASREEKEIQVKNEDSIKKDDSVNDSTATNQEGGESQSLFSFSSSRVFSLSVNDRLVVREVDHSKTSGRRIGRGRGRGRGITSGSKDVGIVGKTMTQSVSSNEDPPVTNNNNIVTDPPPPDSDITSNKPAQEGPSEVPEGQDTVAGDPIESNEVDTKGEPAKPKRYSSRRQKPDQPEGTDSADKTISSTGMEYPPPPFGYGWVYPPHPSMMPHQVDPNSYQAQQQQLHFYQQHMRLLQDMYSQHTGAATGANPPLIPILPHLMGPQDQFTLLPPGTHFPSLTPPPPRYPLSGGDLKPSPTVDISHESSPSPAVGGPAPTEKKPSQAIPIVAPADTQ